MRKKWGSVQRNSERQMGMTFFLSLGALCEADIIVGYHYSFFSVRIRESLAQKINKIIPAFSLTACALDMQGYCCF